MLTSRLNSLLNLFFLVLLFISSLETCSHQSANSWGLCLLTGMSLCCVLCTSPTCSAGPALNRPVVDSRHSVTVRTRRESCLFWKLESILSATAAAVRGGWVSKIQSGNIPVMWNTQLMKRVWTGLSFQSQLQILREQSGTATSKEEGDERVQVESVGGREGRWEEDRSDRTAFDTLWILIDWREWKKNKLMISSLFSTAVAGKAHVANTQTWYVN